MPAINIRVRPGGGGHLDNPEQLALVKVEKRHLADTLQIEEVLHERDNCRHHAILDKDGGRVSGPDEAGDIRPNENSKAQHFLSVIIVKQYQLVGAAGTEN